MVRSASNLVLIRHLTRRKDTELNGDDSVKLRWSVRVPPKLDSQGIET